MGLEGAQAQDTVIYKTLDTFSLQMKVIYPENMDEGRKYPAMVFFFGGGWKKGDWNHFERQANYFAERGMVCFLPNYRVSSRNHTTPFESLKDAKSAIRFVRSHARQFHIDPDKLVGGGGSAGGHLAAACAVIDGFNDEQDDLTISCQPNALVLFNPVIDNGPGGYGYDRIGNRYKEFSPLHNLQAGAPPTIIFLGTNDKLIPVETMKYYKKVMEKVGSPCELFLYEGQGHGFFNDTDYCQKTLVEADLFLSSLGLIQ